MGVPFCQRSAHLLTGSLDRFAAQALALPTSAFETSFRSAGYLLPFKRGPGQSDCRLDVSHLAQFRVFIDPRLVVEPALAEANDPVLRCGPARPDERSRLQLPLASDGPSRLSEEPGTALISHHATMPGTRTGLRWRRFLHPCIHERSRNRAIQLVHAAAAPGAIRRRDTAIPIGRFVSREYCGHGRHLANREPSSRSPTPPSRGRRAGSPCSIS